MTAIFRQWNFSIPILNLAMNKRGDWISASLADGSLRMLPLGSGNYEPKSMNIHRGVSLSLKADADEHAFLSGGDDGKIYIIDPLLDAPTLIADQCNGWIDFVAASLEGYRAYSHGKKIYILNNSGDLINEPTTLPSSVGGIGFSPNGKRLAVSHYNGVSLFWVNSRNALPIKLNWKGSHLNLLWHPDGKILITALQENSLHGWHIQDNKEMQMQGYASKINSMNFTLRGKYLVTSGAEQVICWPFFAGGPWGKEPLILGQQDDRLVKIVCAHPEEEMVAAGYDDGMIILAPLDGRKELVIHPPQSHKNSSITQLIWGVGGNNSLFAAFENGTLAMFTPESVKNFINNGGIS